MRLEGRVNPPPAGCFGCAQCSGRWRLVPEDKSVAHAPDRPLDAVVTLHDDELRIDEALVRRLIAA